VPGGRSVLAEVIRVSTPDNFYPCQLAIAGGFGLFHGLLVRKVTAGQLPVVRELNIMFLHISSSWVELRIYQKLFS
jgi:hypothetical protein